MNDSLTQMPLHLKASDQKGKIGSSIFDPVGTNSYIKSSLKQKGWAANIPISKEFKYLGKDYDFGKPGVLVEVQFSNYPFLLNNVVRSDLFAKRKMNIMGSPLELVIIVTKAHMLPASNSTLYYEQAQLTLDALANNKNYDVPIRLVGLFANNGHQNALWTDYSAARYSRTIATQSEVACTINGAKDKIASIIIP